MPAKSKWLNWATALLLALVLMILSAMTLTAGQPVNSDDFAGYLNQAIAISEGRLDEQIRLNPWMHPSPAPFLNADDETLTYVWGYPLILSLLHKVFGFDTWNYGTMLYYKLPVAFCFGLIGGVLFLFYRRRFCWASSLFLSLCFSLNVHFFSDVNSISPDIPFLLFFLLCLWLIEVALEQKQILKRILFFAILGVCLWYTYVLRLNGFSILMIVAIAHAVHLITQRKGLTLLHLIELLPYALCFLLLQISYLFLPEATSNLSDIGDVDLPTILSHLPYYFHLFCDWLTALFSRTDTGLFHANFLGPLMLIFFVIGVIKENFWRNIHLYVLIACTVLALFLISYRQGLRYTYTILPFLLLYAAHGASHVYRWAYAHMDAVLQKTTSHSIRFIGFLAAFVLVFQTGLYALDCFQHRGDALPVDDMYSTYAVDTYHFIQQNTPDDCTIAYFKPRALYLNTGRFSFKPQLPDEYIHNGEVFLPYQSHRTDLMDADYILICNEVDDNNPMYPYGEQVRRLTSFLEGKAELQCIYQNPSYELYELKK